MAWFSAFDAVTKVSDDIMLEKYGKRIDRFEDFKDLGEKAKADFLKELCSEVFGERITFLGSESFDQGGMVIASFAGAYGKAWNMVMGLSVENSSALQKLKANCTAKTACVFLPDASSPGFGEHDCPGGGDKCYCQLTQKEGGLEYACGQRLCAEEHFVDAPNGGQRAVFGCRWYTLWKRKIDEAIAAKSKFVVVYKKGHKTSWDGSNWDDPDHLGRSQNTEVKYLKSIGLPFATIAIEDFVRVLVKTEKSVDQVSTAGKTDSADDLMVGMFGADLGALGLGGKKGSKDAFLGLKTLGAVSSGASSGDLDMAGLEKMYGLSISGKGVKGIGAKLF